jgi:membrane-associated protease RseP (regulator of RpoE activity)
MELRKEHAQIVRLWVRWRFIVNNAFRRRNVQCNNGSAWRVSMRRVFLTSLFFGAFSIALGQSTPESFSIGVTVVRGKRAECPAFIGSVAKNSPAAKAGLEPGDVLVAVDGAAVSFENAAQRIRSQAANPVTLTVRRGDTDAPITVVLQREHLATILHDNGLKIIQDGRVVPLDTTDEELACLLGFDENRITRQQAFRPTHYPENLNLYYPGFEAFMLDNPAQVAVGGIEQGPASDAGVRWGDVVVSVDGVSVAGRTASQLEDMLSGNEPRKMTIEIERCGKITTFSFALERASNIMRRNQKQAVDGQVMPLGIPKKYLSCFM